MEKWRQNLFLIAVLLSLLIHIGTGLNLYWLGKSKKKKQNTPVEITIVDQSKKKRVQRQIVEQSKKPINNEIDEKAKYLSRHNQRVAEQTRASKHGKFQNNARDGLLKKAPKNQKQKPSKKSLAQNQKKKRTLSKTGTVSLPTLSQLKPKFDWKKTVGVRNPGKQSATDDHLKNLKNGAQTLLSTREFVYYTYYARIKERLRMFWEPKIKQKVKRLFMSGRKIASVERITKLVITLDNQGKLVNVQVLGASGLKDLDSAAVEAFQAAAPFPNPPKGIVEQDGRIRIRWDFILEA